MVVNSDQIFNPVSSKKEMVAMMRVYLFYAKKLVMEFTLFHILTVVPNTLSVNT